MKITSHGVHPFTAVFFTAVLLLVASFARADLVLIASASAPASRLTPEDIKQLYTGRTSALPDGTRVSPLDQQEGGNLRAQFLEKVLGKTEQQYRNYWTRQVFTGKGQPPRIVNNDADVLRLVASGNGFIGYVDSKSVTGNVKVLFRVE